MLNRTSALRRALAAVLLVALVLSGMGRAMAAVALPTMAVATIAGVTVPICHDNGGDPPVPAGPGHHDCCDVCALCAPVSLAEGAPFVAPARVQHFAGHVDALAWAPAIARIPTPRLSQGPPAA